MNSRFVRALGHLNHAYIFRGLMVANAVATQLIPLALMPLDDFVRFTLILLPYNFTSALFFSNALSLFYALKPDPKHPEVAHLTRPANKAPLYALGLAYYCILYFSSITSRLEVVDLLASLALCVVAFQHVEVALTNVLFSTGQLVVSHRIIWAYSGATSVMIGLIALCASAPYAIIAIMLAHLFGLRFFIQRTTKFGRIDLPRRPFHSLLQPDIMLNFVLIPASIHVSADLFRMLKAAVSFAKGFQQLYPISFEQIVIRRMPAHWLAITAAAVTATLFYGYIKQSPLTLQPVAALIVISVSLNRYVELRPQAQALRLCLIAAFALAVIGISVLK